MVNVTDIALAIAQIMLGAAIGESLCEFLIGPAWDWLARRLKIEDDPRAIIMRLFSALLGVGIALEYRLDIPALLGMGAVHGWVGQVLTGMLLGRGSNAVHEFFAKWVAQCKEEQATALLAIKAARAAWEK